MRYVITIALLLMLSTPIWAETDAAKIPPKSIETIAGTLGKLTELLNEESDNFFHQGNYDRAIAALQMVTDLDPTDVQAYGDAAWLMDSRGRKADAIAMLSKGISANPDTYEIFADLGHLYYDDKNYSQAALYFAQAAARPDCPEILWHMLAHSYERSGDLKKSIETWQHALTLEPGDAVVTSNLKRVVEELAAESKAGK